jgi:hypothetical protein
MTRKCSFDRCQLQLLELCRPRASTTSVSMNINKLRSLGLLSVSYVQLMDLDNLSILL